MSENEILTKINEGLNTIELSLKNFEYENHGNYETINCIGNIIKINNREFKTFSVVQGIGQKLDMKYKPDDLIRLKEVSIHMNNNRTLNLKYELHQYLSLDLQFPNSVIEKLYNAVEKNFKNESPQVILNLKLIDSIKEIYKAGTLNDDDIIIYLGEEYEDDDFSYSWYEGKINISINIQHKMPYTIGNNENTTLYSINY